MKKFWLIPTMPLWLIFVASALASDLETWIEIRSPNFIVISNAALHEAKRTAKSFEQFRLLMQATWPQLNVDPPEPLTIFAEKDEKSYKTLFAERQEDKSVQPVGLFIAGPQRQIVALRIDAAKERNYHVIYHEYVHMLMRLNFGDLPLWLSEGLAELFANADISDESQGIGRFNQQSALILRNNPIIPLRTLMSATQDSPYYRQKEKADIFYAQSWALVHYLYLGERRAHQAKLFDFIKLILAGVPEQEAAARSFGNLGALEKSLKEYIQSTTYYLSVNARLGMDSEQYESRVLTPAEFLAAQGELLVHCNKLGQAKTALEQALSLSPRNGQAHEGMGYLWMRLNDRSRTIEHFTIAAEMGSRNCLAPYFAAEKALSKSQLDEAERYLRQAIAINPQFAPAYGKLSQLLSARSPQSPEALELAGKGAALQPGHIAYKLNLAFIMASTENKMDDAYDLGHWILCSARDESDRRQANSLLNWIKDYRSWKAQSR
jgi:tetratricopeptide (TPR) repeat protein